MGDKPIDVHSMAFLDLHFVDGKYLIISCTFVRLLGRVVRNDDGCLSFWFI